MSIVGVTNYRFSTSGFPETNNVSFGGSRLGRKLLCSNSLEQFARNLTAKLIKGFCVLGGSRSECNGALGVHGTFFKKWQKCSFVTPR